MNIDERIQFEQSVVETAHIVKTNPLKFFTPTGAQNEWIKMLGNHKPSKPRVKFFSGSNKCLKTGGTVASLASVIWGPQNGWFNHPMFKEWPYEKNVWIISEDSTLMKILIPEMKKWFPRGKYQTIKHGRNYEHQWICDGKDGEWNLWVMTYDMDIEKFESDLIGLCIFSEPPPKGIYSAIPARMIAGGVVWMEFTPLSNSAWIHDELLSDITIDRKPIPHVELGYNDRMEIIYADIESACKQHGIRGLWEHEEIQRTVEEYDEDERTARARGRYSFLRGRIFPDDVYNEDVVVIPPYTLPVNTQYQMVIDPHPVKYPFISWFALPPFGDHQWILIREYPEYEKGTGYETLGECELTIAEHAANIKEIEENAGMNIITRRIMDPRMGKQKFQNDKKNVQFTYAEHGINCILPMSQLLDVRHDAIKENIKVQKKTGRSKGAIFETCGNTRRALKNYKRKIKRGVSGNQAFMNEVEETYKDPIDNLGYFLSMGPKYDHAVSPIVEGWRGRINRRRQKESENVVGAWF